jgi:hypothetical protein
VRSLFLAYVIVMVIVVGYVVGMWWRMRR